MAAKREENMEKKGVNTADVKEVKWDDRQSHWIGPLTKVVPAELKSGGWAVRDLVVKGKK